MLNAIWQTIANLGLDFDSMKTAVDNLVSSDSGFFNSLFSTIAGIFTSAVNQ